MDDYKWICRLALVLVKGVGPATSRSLISHLGSEEAIFADGGKALLSVPNLSPKLRNELTNPSYLERARHELDFARRNGVQLLFYTDKEYPYRLAECKDAPLLIFYKGNCPLNASKLLGVVGTRRMTDAGRINCEQILSDLATRHSDLVIVSGLAYGVDVCAHRAALAHGLRTVGVMGTGMSHIYPAEHRQVATQMKEQGGLLTEYYSDMQIDRNNFVARNRIIAGLSDAVLVVESAEKGGALLTAEFANSYSRDVFALPGRVTDVYSVGCNNLIRDNKAALVTSAEDIERQMNWDVAPAESSSPELSLLPEMTMPDLSEEERNVMQLIRKKEKIQINDIALELNLPIAKLSGLLFKMEFSNLIHQLPGGLYAVGR
jgi:DNA processing protein